MHDKKSILVEFQIFQSPVGPFTGRISNCYQLGGNSDLVEFQIQQNMIMVKM